MNISIYAYTDSIEFLSAVFQERQAQNKRFSLSDWARQLGFSNATQLSLVLSRKRPISNVLVRRLRTFLGMSEQEARYLSVLALQTNAKSERERALYRQALKRLRPVKDQNALRADWLKIARHWYHPVIYEMAGLRDFKADPAWIAAKLRDRVKAADVKEALARLMRVGVLELDEQGRVVKGRAGFRLPSDVPASSLRALHHQMMRRASESLDRDPEDERDVRSVVVLSNHERILRAKEMTRAFQRELVRFLEVPPGRADAVLSFNMQLFDHVEPD